MANSPALAEFLFKSCHDAITKYKAGEEDPDKLLRLSEWLASFRATGKITDAQLAALTAELEIEVDVPDAPSTYESDLAALTEEVGVQADAIAELSEIISGEGE